MLQEKQKFYGWKLVAVLWLIYLINTAFTTYGGSMINTYMVQDLNMSRTVLGLGYAVFIIMNGLPSPLVGRVINKKGVRFALAIGAVVLIISSVMMATVVKNATVFVLCFGILMGLGACFGGQLPAQTTVTMWFSQKRALAMAIVLTGAGIGGFVCGPIISKCIEVSGGNWRIAWYFIAAMSVVSLILALLFVKNKPSDIGQNPDGIITDGTAAQNTTASPSKVFKTTEEWTYKKAMKTSSLWLLIFGALGAFMPYNLCVAHGIIHLADRGFDPAVAAMSLGIITLFSIVGRLLGGFLGDRIETKYVWCISLVILLVGTVVGMNASNVVSVYIYAICVGVGFGTVFVCLPTTLGNYFGTGAFTSIMGTVLPIVAIISALAPVIGGKMFDVSGSYNMAFITMSAFTVIGIVCLLVAKPPKLSK